MRSILGGSLTLTSAWIDSGVSVETLTSVINTSYSTDYATTRLSEMTGIEESLIKEIVCLPLDELSAAFCFVWVSRSGVRLKLC